MPIHYVNVEQVPDFIPMSSGGGGTLDYGYTTSGPNILDAGLNVVQLRGINHYGFQQGSMLAGWDNTFAQNYNLPAYMWLQNWYQQLVAIKAAGFNAVRIPVSPDTIYTQLTVSEYNTSLVSPYNTEFGPKTPLECLDMVMNGCDQLGLYILLDFHQSSGLQRNGNPVMVDKLVIVDHISSVGTLCTAYCGNGIGGGVHHGMFGDPNNDGYPRSTVNIAGASPSSFNGTYVVNAVDASGVNNAGGANRFTYTSTSYTGTATGAIIVNHQPYVREIYDQQPYTLAKWTSDLAFLAARYRACRYFIGIDVFNEPHGIRWTTGDSNYDNNNGFGRQNYDYLEYLYNQAGAAILAANPNLLVFIEGGESHDDTTPNPNIWIGYGETFLKLARGELTLTIPSNKIVLAPHTYGPDVTYTAVGPGLYPEKFTDPTFPANLPPLWDILYGDLAATYPIIIGEFGGKYGDPPHLSAPTWSSSSVTYALGQLVNFTLTSGGSAGQVRAFRARVHHVSTGGNGPAAAGGDNTNWEDLGTMESAGPMGIDDKTWMDAFLTYCTGKGIKSGFWWAAFNSSDTYDVITSKYGPKHQPIVDRLREWWMS